MSAAEFLWPHPACLPEEALLASCEMRRHRGGGPGGQRRNRVETAVALVHRPTGIVGRASEERSPERNRLAAVRRLRLALAVELRTPDAGQIPRSSLWRSRVKDGHIACNPAHDDFPSMVAEALDVVAWCNWDAKGAADLLGCSPSQLVRFLQDHPPAFVAWNRGRVARGLRPLR